MEIRKLFLMTSLLLISLTIRSQIVIKASDYGVKSDSYLNASTAINKAITACAGKKDVVLELPGGRIDLWPEGSFKKILYISNSTETDTLSKLKSIALLFEGNQNITIEGNNSLIMLHGKMESFAFLNCSNVLIKNISFDYERPTMSELRITSVSPGEIKTEVHPDTRFDITEGRIIFYGEGWKNNSNHTISCNPVTGIMKYSSFRPFLESKAVQTGCREVVFTGDFSKTGLHADDVITVRDPYRDNSGAFINLSKNIKLENIKMHYMHGLGIVSQFSENITLSGVTVAPRRESGRLISAFADCFHFSGCRGTILIDSCFTSGSHDDPVNVHGTHLKITSIPDRKIIVQFIHHQTYGFEAFFEGDSISVIDPETLKPRCYGIVKNARLVNKREMELEVDFSDESSVQKGYCIENITWTPEVIIRNSRFERTNTRGLLITTRRRVLIENNVFFRTGMHAILISDDASGWFESGPVKSVTIRKNVFQECGYNQAPDNFIIAIAPENHKLVPGYMVHQNILIENNIFKIYDYPLLTAKSTGNLVFASNKIINTGFITAGEKRAQFGLNACTGVVIRDNDFENIGTPSIKCENMKRKDIRTDLEIDIEK